MSVQIAGDSDPSEITSENSAFCNHTSILDRSEISEVVVCRPGLDTLSGIKDDDRRVGVLNLRESVHPCMQNIFLRLRLRLCVMITPDEIAV